MKKKFLNISALAILVLSLSCSKSDEGTDVNRYLIFGHSYGECIGDLCVEIFKLTESQLFEDVNDKFFKDNVKFKLLSDEKHLIALDLFKFYPKELENETNKSFGCPDCMDQGAIILQYFDEKCTSQRFVIDQHKNDIPLYLHEYVDRINDKIRLLNL